MLMKRKRWSVVMWCGVVAAALAVLVVRSVRAAPPYSFDPTEQAARMTKLVELLGDPDYRVRQQAQDELSRLGYDAVDALTAAQTHEDLEVSKRVRYLLRQLKVELLEDDDPPQVKSELSGYERQDEPGRRQRIRQLANLQGAMGAPALCRVVRFEPSKVLSKVAAVEVLKLDFPQGNAGRQRGELLGKSLGASLRPGAMWIRIFVQAQAAPDDMLATWRELTRAEETLQADSPASTSNEVVLGLLGYQAQLEKQLKHHGDAHRTMMQMIALEGQPSPTLTKLIDELVNTQDWQTLEAVAEQYPERINADASLLYLLAEARLKRGDKDLANELAARAAALYPTNRSAHVKLAYELGQRNL